MIYSRSGISSNMAESSYLDRPDDDGTGKAHPAYWRGRARGTAEILKIIKRVAEGNDPGDGKINSPVIEAARQIILKYRETLTNASDKSTYSSKQAQETLQECTELAKKVTI